MPAKSKAQARLMGLVASGKKKIKGLTKEKAKEYLRGVDVSHLPAHSPTSKRTPKKRSRSYKFS